MSESASASNRPPQPTLATQRLRLRPFTLDDAERVCTLAGDRAVSDTTANIPHPYEPGMAEAWIGTHAAQYSAGKVAIFAITQADTGLLVGALGLTRTPEHNHAELGYWVGRPWWNQGYVTEAAQAIIRYGFDTLGLHRIFATHLTRNPASGRVLQKLGMTHEGVMRQHIRKWDVYEDTAIYGLLHDDPQ